VIWTNIKAAAWINKLPETREGMTAGCKSTLQSLWDHVDQGVESDTEHGSAPWASVETLAEERGVKVATVKARLAKLTALGWVRRVRGRRLLAWSRPFESPPAQATDGDSNHHRRRLESPPTATRITTDGDSNHHNQVKEQVQEPSQEHTTPARKPTRSTPRQPDLIAGPEVDPLDAVFAELLDEHEQLRKAALVHHKRKATGLPSRASKHGRALHARLRRALEQHGPEVCRRVLAWQATEWREKPDQLEWSTSAVWSDGSLAYSIPRSAGKSNGQRAGPSRGLPVEPDAPDRTYYWQDDPIP
jgi:hypothetical protein